MARYALSAKDYSVKQVFEKWLNASKTSSMYTLANITTQMNPVQQTYFKKPDSISHTETQY